MDEKMKDSCNWIEKNTKIYLNNTHIWSRLSYQYKFYFFVLILLDTL